MSRAGVEDDVGRAERVPMIRVQWTRGARVESEHQAVAAVVARDGQLRSFGDAATTFYLRSVAKPFQTLALFPPDVPGQFRLTPPEIAVITASHPAQARHTELVAGILARAGLAPDQLRCGTHAPLSSRERRRRARAGLPLTVLDNNCSGKHAGMLLHATAIGADLSSYLEPEHPVQRAVAEMVAGFFDLDVANLETGIDGCGVPTFYTDVERTARAFWRLGDSDFVARRNLGAAVREVESALHIAPEAFSGEGRLPYQLASLIGDRFLSKEGAEGVFVVWGDPGVLVIKILDGQERAYRQALPVLMRACDFIDDGEFERWREVEPPLVHNVAGRVVGEIRTVW